MTVHSRVGCMRMVYDEPTPGSPGAHIRRSPGDVSGLHFDGENQLDIRNCHRENAVSETVLEHSLAKLSRAPDAGH
jgi:hypothetical protein